MKFTYYLTVAFLVVAVTVPATAQISFNRSYFESQAGQVIDQSYYDRSDLGINPLEQSAVDIITDIVENRTGPNQTYDFSGISYNLRGSLQFGFKDSPAGLPGSTDPAFSAANFVSTSVIPGLAENYIYYVLSDTAFTKLGVHAETTFGVQTITYSPPVVETKLPLTDGTAWTSVENSSLGSSFDLAGTVEGYGTLILPGGVQAPALRIKRFLSSEIAPGFVRSSTTYEFWTLEGHVATIEYEQELLQEEELYAITYTVAADVATSNESQGELPSHIVLEQNYPNPFNPSTVIPFEVSSAGPVSLQVFDTLGRQVASLIESHMPAGRHEISWEPSNVPSGVYYYRLAVDGASVTRSLQLLR